MDNLKINATIRQQTFNSFLFRSGDFHEIKDRASKRRNDHQVQLELNMERMGTKVVEFHNVSKSFGDKKMLDKFEYNFNRGERVGIIGKNGTGKSTFLNILTGALKPDGGKVVVGETVQFGYYTQAGINIKEGQKVIDVIREYGDYIPLKKRQADFGIAAFGTLSFRPKKAI